MACCKCCCGNTDCDEGQEGKCCCGGTSGSCCQAGQYCCDGTCQSTPCGGACCDATFGCTQTADEETCTDEGGIWVGPGVPCDPDPCDCTLCVYTTVDDCGHTIYNWDNNIGSLECATFTNGTWHHGPSKVTIPSYTYDNSYACNDPQTAPSLEINPCTGLPVGTLSFKARVLGGPGTELKALLSKIGITSSPTCSCNKRAKTMDENGIEWCEQNVETICDWLAEESAKRKLPFVRLAGKALIHLAIRRAKKATNR